MPLVRYYGREYDSSRFRYIGIRGRVVFILSWIISKLERLIEWHVMHLLAVGMPKSHLYKLEEVFKEQDKDKKIKETIAILTTENSIDIKDRQYKTRKFGPNKEEDINYKPQTYREQRQSKAKQFFVSQLAPGRSGRYSIDRRKRVADPEGDVVEKNSNEK